MSINHPVVMALRYAYDRVDNLGIPSATCVVPMLQHLAVGDLIPMSPDGKQGLWVKDLEANRSMLWWDNKGDATWCWGLYTQEETQTRLITRVRLHYVWTSPWILFNLLLDVGDIVMMASACLALSGERSRHSLVLSRKPR